MELAFWYKVYEKLDYEKYRDLHVIAPMAEYSGYFLQLRGRRWYVYKCKNLLENNDCGIYNERPSMCRDHPTYDVTYPVNGCEYKGCTYKNNPLMLRKDSDDKT